MTCCKSSAALVRRMCGVAVTFVRMLEQLKLRKNAFSVLMFLFGRAHV